MQNNTPATAANAEANEDSLRALMQKQIEVSVKQAETMNSLQASINQMIQMMMHTQITAATVQPNYSHELMEQNRLAHALRSPNANINL